MWKKEELYYKDATASFQAALEGFPPKAKQLKERDFKALVEVVDEVESAYS